jgi:hypothetical protein
LAVLEQPFQHGRRQLAGFGRIKMDFVDHAGLLLPVVMAGSSLNLK